jgi:tRNA pseudouridine38-40 synthase
VCSVPLREEEHLGRLQRALDRRLPEDIVIREVRREDAEFHARFSATGRHYVYRFSFERDPFLRRNHLCLSDEVEALDLEAMAAACTPLIGEHDATSLCRRASLEEGRTVCRVERAEILWSERGGELHLEADRFLHSMVRIVVGTLLEVGRGKRDVFTFREVLAARDRGAAGDTAPPVGLCLEEVRYDRSRDAAAGSLESR